MSIYAAESKRLWLESLTVEKHLDDYHEILSQPAAMMWSSVNHPHLSHMPRFNVNISKYYI